MVVAGVWSETPGADFAKQAIRLYGNSTIGYYYVRVMVGTPPQEQTLIVDTGSLATIFDCVGCRRCNSHESSLFNPQLSFTFQRLELRSPHKGIRCYEDSSPPSQSNLCRFRQSYLEGSRYQGYWASDTFGFSSMQGAPIMALKHTFGCATLETREFFRQKANGILGLGLHDPYEEIPPTIVDRELAAHKKKAFSVCIAENGGWMTFGEGIPQLHSPGSSTGVIEATEDEWKMTYTAALTAIMVNGQPLDYDFASENDAGILAPFDIGTTFVYFPGKLFAEWKRVFVGFCAENGENCGGSTELRECYKADEGESERFLGTFPLMTFIFRGSVRYQWRPREYMIWTGSSYCFGVRKLDQLILGAAFMRNYDITFMTRESKISFTRANCSKFTTA